MQRRLGQVDLTTGEIHQDGFVALIVPKRRNGFQEGWVAMAQVQAFAKLAKREARKVLGEEGFGVLLGALSRLDYENLLVLNQAELARELEMSSPSVNRAIKRLVELSVLLEGPRIGVSRSYRLNPEFGWKGSAKGHVQALDTLRTERMKAARISGVIAGGQAAEPGPDRDTLTGDLFENA